MKSYSYLDVAPELVVEIMSPDKTLTGGARLPDFSVSVDAVFEG